MREIKFRAWDKTDKRIYEVLNLDLEQNHKCEVCKCDEFHSSRYFIYKYKLMQYTGLKDKNGKEIYEGDVIEFEDTTEDGYEYKEGIDITNRASIVFKNCRFELDNIIETTSGVLVDMEEDWELFIDSLKSSKVIGNIYENPELLKDKDD